jgi:hypothetical protein
MTKITNSKHSRTTEYPNHLVVVSDIGILNLLFIWPATSSVESNLVLVYWCFTIS